MIKKSVKFAESFRNGDIEQHFSEEELSLKDEMGSLLRALNDMSQKIKEVVIDIFNGASNVADAGQQINATTQQISQGANEQASAVEEVSSSMKW